MDSTKENIKCEKNGQTKFFSQKQLDLIGQSRDGSYDGWFASVEVPTGIPAKTVLPVGDGKKNDAQADPNGGLTVITESAKPDETGQGEANQASGTDEQASTNADAGTGNGEATTTADAATGEQASIGEAGAEGEKPNTNVSDAPDPNAVKHERVKKGH